MGRWDGTAAVFGVNLNCVVGTGILMFEGGTGSDGQRSRWEFLVIMYWMRMNVPGSVDRNNPAPYLAGNEQPSSEGDLQALKPAP